MNESFLVKLSPNFEFSAFDTAFHKPSLKMEFMAANFAEAIKIAQNAAGSMFSVVDAQVDHDNDDASSTPMGNVFLSFIEREHHRNTVGRFIPAPSKKGMTFTLAGMTQINTTARDTYSFFKNRTSIHGDGGDPHMPIINIHNIDALIALDMDVKMFTCDEGNRVCAASGSPVDDMRLRLLI